MAIETNRGIRSVARICNGRWLWLLLGASVVRKGLALGLSAGLLAASFLGAPLARADAPPWSANAYSYFAQSVPLSKVLTDFAAGFNLVLEQDGEIAGNVNGRLTAPDPTQFITDLGRVYGFVWYVHTGTLYVSRTDRTETRRLNVPNGSLNGLRKVLTDVGLVNAAFGWGELPEQSGVVVSGPPSYVAQLDSFLKTLERLPSTQKIGIFKLKYASVEDRTIVSRNANIVQPGMVSVLRGIVGAGGAGSAVADASASAKSPGLNAVVPGVSSVSSTTTEPAAAVAGAAPRAAPEAFAKTQALRGGGSIQSDPRLNMLIILDEPERLQWYERIISELDVPTAQIEIEALIVDINTERASELGISWSGRVNGNTLTFGAPTATQGVGVVNIVAGSSTLLLDQGAQLLGQIRMLESKGDAKIVSRPSVLTTDNVGAVLDLSESFYVRQQGERVTNLTSITAGITLRVTPRVIVSNGENLVHLAIDIEDGQLLDTQVDTLPVVRRGAVSTAAIVRPNETLLIAGHTTERRQSTQQKVPMLGNIPLFGRLFSNESNSTQKIERLFMIRHKILPGFGAVLKAGP